MIETCPQCDAISQDAYGMMLNIEANSRRQIVEWGMCGFQQSCLHMKDYLIYEEDGGLNRITQLMVMRYNARSWLVGIDQIKQIFYPNLIKDSSLYEEIFMEGLTK
eukprot:14766064-Ditylum_brightwellii.AAC.1